MFKIRYYIENQSFKYYKKSPFIRKMITILYKKTLIINSNIESKLGKVA
jgi:hypothetical protein